MFGGGGDIWSREDERLRRQALIEQQRKQREQNSGGFFGGIGRTLENVGDAIGTRADAVGNFFGGMVESIYDSAETAGRGIGDVIGGQIALNEKSKLVEREREITEENRKRLERVMGKDIDNPQSARWEDPEVRRVIEEGNQRLEQNRQSTAARRAELDERQQRAQDVDPVATAAGAADTFLNVASLGVGGALKNTARAGINQVGRAFGREATERVGREALTGPLTNRQALGRIGDYTSEGVGFGASQSALQNLRDNGEDADMGSVWQDALVGGTLGGALTGTAGTLLNRNVRAAVPGIARAGREFIADRAQFAADSLSNSMTGYSPGFIRVPFGPEGPTPGSMVPEPDAPKSWEDAFIDEQAASYRNTDELVDDLTNQLWAENKKGKGVDTGLIPDEYGSGFSGRWAVSNNSPLYQAFYRRYGTPPTKKGIRDMVQQTLGDPRAANEHDNLLDGIEWVYGEGDSYREVFNRLRDHEGYLNELATREAPSDIPSPMDAIVGRRTVERLPRGAQGMTPARVVEARQNPAMDFAGAYPDEVPSRMSDVVTDLTGQGPLPSVPANPAVPRPTFDEWNQRMLRGEMPLQNPQLALPSGLPENPLGPVRMTRSELRAAARRGELPENYVINPRQGRGTLTAAPDGRVAPTKEFKNEFAIDDARAALGGKDPVLTKTGKVKTHGGRPIDNEIREVLEEVLDSHANSGDLEKVSAFNDLNGALENVTRSMGGPRSRAFQILNQKTREAISEANAIQSGVNDTIRRTAREMDQRFAFRGDEAKQVNKWLSQQTDAKARQAAFNKMSPDLQQRAQEFYNTVRGQLDEARQAYNAKVVELGYPDRQMGDLGKFYFPRVYKPPTIKDAILDASEGILDTKQGGLGKSGFNPNTLSGTTTPSAPALPGNVRRAGQAPVGSEFAEPTIGYTGHAQSRTARSPVQELVNPIEAYAKYMESVTTITNRSNAVDNIRQVQKVIDEISDARGDNSLQTLRAVLESSANALLGKTNRFDRPFIDFPGGNKWIRAAGAVSRALSKSQLLGSIRTVAAQTGQAPLIAAEAGVENATKGVRMMFDKGFDDLVNQSNFIKSNFPRERSAFSAQNVQKVINKSSDIAGKPMDYTAETFAKTAWAAGYQKAIAEGMEEGSKAAIREADRIAGKIAADRSAGLRASVYESRVLQPVAMYTQDINQIWQASKQMIGTKNYKGFGTLLAATFAYNALYEQFIGERLGADPVNAAIDAGGILFGNDLVDSEGNPIGVGERLARAGGRMVGEGAAYTPLGNAVLGSIYPERGIRIPFSGGDRMLTRSDLFGDSQIGRFGGSVPMQAAFENPALMLGIPGFSQAQRTVEGLNAYGQGASISPSGEERYTIDQNFLNLLNSMIGGQYATEEGRAYLEERNARLRGERDQSAVPLYLQR